MRFSILLGAFLLHTVSLASFFDDCDVTAEVTALEELSLFSKGSQSEPASVPQGASAVYTFRRIPTLKILSAQSQGGHTDCQHMLENTFRVVLDSKKDLEGIDVGSELKLNRKYYSSLTPEGVSYGETWTLRP